jgi:hypothetical protein
MSRPEMEVLLVGDRSPKIDEGALLQKKQMALPRIGRLRLWVAQFNR